MWPKSAREIHVPTANVITSCEYHEQRRGIDAAVITAKWNFAKRSHFAFSRLMQDFARLGITLWILFIRLRSGQIPQHSPRNAGRHPKALEGRDDAVAPKRCAEPRHTRVRV